MYIRCLEKFKAVFTETEMNNEQKINFLQSSRFGIQHTCPSVFFIGTIYQPLRSGRIWHKVNF